MPPVPSVGPLHDVTCVEGESFVVSDPAGDIRTGTEQGLFVRDTRFLNRLTLAVDGHRVHPLEGGSLTSGTAVFYGYSRRVASAAVDPALLVTRRRVVAGSLHEEVLLENRGRAAHDLTVEVTAASDFAYIFDVKQGLELPQRPPEPVDGGLRFARTEGTERLELTADPVPDAVDGGTLRWSVHLEPGRSVGLCLDATVTDEHGTTPPARRCGAFEAAGAPPAAPSREEVELRTSDRGFDRLIRQSVVDLDALQVHDPTSPDDRFCTAGSPWFLTLFGRDAIWAALMALPYDRELAAGTLRVLARRQGRRHDRDTEEAPGKVLHEIRRGSLSERGQLPATYYGTIDATPLFAVLLSEAWRWGLPDAEVEALLPHLEAALRWIVDDGVGEDGFLRYVRRGARGLVNQGWKDSHDGVQFADGTIARAPIALAEVQGYAHDAALRGAELLEHFGRSGAEGWRRWAAELARRFRDRYWVQDDLGGFPAIALDREGRPVDAPTSNMGHLLMSGILSDEEAARVAARLSHPSMASGWGLRTMATTAAGYNPLSYHGGSVWPHDTAIAVWGLTTTGQHGAARSLLLDLVRAAPHFGYRLPELLSGLPRQHDGFPVPYPAACRPQAWAAGAGLLLLRSVLGARPDVPHGRLVLRPMWPPPWRRLELRSARLAGGRVDVTIDVDGTVDVELTGADLAVEVVLPDGT